MYRGQSKITHLGVSPELLAAQLAAAQNPSTASFMYPYLGLFPSAGFGAYANLAGLNQGKKIKKILSFNRKFW